MFKSKFSLMCVLITISSWSTVGLITLVEYDLEHQERTMEEFVCSELLDYTSSWGGARAVDLTVGQAVSTYGDEITCQMETRRLNTLEPVTVVAKLSGTKGFTFYYN